MVALQMQHTTDIPVAPPDAKNHFLEDSTRIAFCTQLKYKSTITVETGAN